MKLKINFNCEIKEFNYLIKKNRKDLLKIFKFVVEEEGKNIDFKNFISINLINSEKMKYYNNQYRKFNKTTDVLSFTNNEIFKKSIDLGDIFINVEIIKEQADSIESNEDMELKFLFLHGVLHLHGYDHKTPEEEKEMIEMQNYILKTTKIRY